MVDSLIVNDFFLSLQGESRFAGWPCVFIRLTACNLRCSYCDSAYAFTEGHPMTLAAILERVQTLAKPYEPTSTHDRLPLVELTGGEPLLQANSRPLMRSLCDAGFQVLLETNGALDISTVDARVHRIMDLKGPSSGEESRNRWSNLDFLTPRDEIKFVIGTHEDYAWARDVIQRHQLAKRCPLLFSWAAPLTPAKRDRSLKPPTPNQTPLTQRELADRIVADSLPVRFQLQLHKYLWPADARGV